MQKHFCTEFQDSVRIINLKIRVGRIALKCSQNTLTLVLYLRPHRKNCGRVCRRLAAYLW